MPPVQRSDTWSPQPKDIVSKNRLWLHVNKKTIEGQGHVDRDAQLSHINSTCQEFEQKGAPIISVDGKKKALSGNCKNNGREWQAKGEETCVNVYDFLSSSR